MAESRKKWVWIVIGAAALAFGLALAAYAYMGSFMRYSGDDYCYAGMMAQHGFWEAQPYSYIHPYAYHGNRYSLTFFSGLAGLFGPRANAVLPGLVTLVWVVGLFLLFRRFQDRGLEIPSRQQHAQNGPPWPLLALTAAVVVFFTYFQTQEIAQSLYWRSGMLPYLAPLVAITFLIGLIDFAARKARFSLPILLGIFLLAIVSGGFSETGVAVQAGILGIMLLAALVSLRWWDRRFARWLLPVSLALAGSLAALFLLAFSPAIRDRLEGISRAADPILVAQMSFAYTRDFIWLSLRGLWLPTLVVLATVGVLSMLVYSIWLDPGPTRAVSFLLHLAGASLVCFFLIFSSVVPTAYAETSYPEPRALIIARFVMVAAEAWIAWQFGKTAAAAVAAQKLSAARLPGYLSVGLAGLLLVLSLYPLRGAKTVVAEAPRYRKWSAYWDRRDRVIREARQAGLRQVEVMVLDHIIPRVAELNTQPGNWYNGCAATAYGMDSILATLPGWDE